MRAVTEQVLNQLPKHHRLIAKVLDERWAEVSEVCPDTDGKLCTLTGKICSWQNCPKLEAGSGEGEER